MKVLGNGLSAAYLTIFTFLLSCCQENNINPHQHKSTLSHLNCYNELLTELRNDSIGKIIREVIRPDKRSGSLDRVNVSPEYRFIEIEEVAHLISETWLSNCNANLKKTSDLLGFRYPVKDLIVLEINRMRRRLVRDKISYDKTYEFHRLIYGEGTIDHSQYFYGNEFIIWEEELEPGLFYEVSQQKRIH
jgi:hypothetical protein